MEKITKLGAADFAKKAKSLEIGEHFNFASDADSDGEPRTEEELKEWYGVQMLCLFDNEMVLISKYGGTNCNVFPADADFLADDIKELFGAVFGDFVYIVEKGAEKQEVAVSLTPSFCIDIRNATHCGENILIPSREAHELATDIDKYNVSADIVSKAEELGNTGDLTLDTISRIAEIVIDRRDDCCVISEAYWQIVEEVIGEVLKEKQQKA